MPIIIRHMELTVVVKVAKEFAEEWEANPHTPHWVEQKAFDETVEFIHGEGMRVWRMEKGYIDTVDEYTDGWKAYVDVWVKTR